MVPGWGLYPIVGLSTLATIIASQALISGAFSVTRQALMLGFLPRVRIQHTSAHQIGQIYVPIVNWLLMIAAVLAVWGFGSSSGLAAAYGVAVTLDMTITTLLAYVVARVQWHWGKLPALAVTIPLLCLELTFSELELDQGRARRLVPAHGRRGHVHRLHDLAARAPVAVRRRCKRARCRSKICTS